MVLGCNLKNDKMILVRFQGKSFNIMVVQAYAPTTDAKEAEVDQFFEELGDLELTTTTTTKNHALFIIGDWNAKVGSQEIPGVTGKFGLGEQNEAGQRVTEFCQKNALVIANVLLHDTRDDFTHEHHRMANIEIKLITLFVAEDGEAVYSQQKQDLELTVAHIISFP